MERGIGIAGIGGRMGRLLVEEVTASGGKLAGGIERAGVAVPDGVRLFPNIAALAEASDVVMEFTHASTAIPHARALAAAGTAWVLGTTGLGAVEEAKRWRRRPNSSAVVYAANFSPGVNLVPGAGRSRWARRCRGISMRRRNPGNAPPAKRSMRRSGTAVFMGRAVAKGRGVNLDEVTESGRVGHTGARRAGKRSGSRQLRGGQVVGDHTLLFASATEHIALTHRAFDRRAFATGAVRAALWTEGRKPGLYSMMDVLGMR